MNVSTNPILASKPVEVIDLADLASPTVLTRPQRSTKREFLDLRRAKNAVEAVTTLTTDNELYGFTKGQFSLLDLLTALMDRTGPAHLTISTWTAARKEIVDIERLLSEGKLTSTRWLVDYTFARRDRSALHHIRQVFGPDSVRVANTHSKFALFANDQWRLVLRSSMNLNMNPRFEDFTLANDPELYAFIDAIVSEIFAKQKKHWADNAKPGEHLKYFQQEM